MPRDVLGGGADIEGGGGGATDLSAYTGDVNITGDLTASGALAGSEASAGKVAAGDAGVVFGSAQDTNLYRSAADTLKTDDSLTVAGTNGVTIGSGGSIAAISASLLQATGAFYTVNDIRAGNTAERTRMGNAGPAGKAGIVFGSAEDTNLYRPQADTLKTDDTLVINNANGLQVANGSYTLLSTVGTSFSDVGRVQVRWQNSVAGILDGYNGLDVAVFNTGGAIPIVGRGMPTARGTQVSDLLNLYKQSDDANPVVKVGSDGKVSIGAGGATAVDTNLYRAAASSLKTDGNFSSGGTVIANAATGSQVNLLSQTGVAAIQFGSAGDINLYRVSSGVLKSDGTINAGAGLEVTGQSASSNLVLRSSATGDTVHRFTQLADGSMSWGSGTATRDTNLFRVGVTALKTDGIFYAGSNIGATGTVYGANGAPAQTLLGAVGPSSASGVVFGSANDTNLYRSAADTLKTDDNFIALSFDVVGANGAGWMQYVEQTSDPAAPSADRAKVFARDNGSGKTQLCVRFPTGAVQVIATEP